MKTLSEGMTELEAAFKKLLLVICEELKINKLVEWTEKRFKKMKIENADVIKNDDAADIKLTERMLLIRAQMRRKLKSEYAKTIVPYMNIVYGEIKNNDTTPLQAAIRLIDGEKYSQEEKDNLIIASLEIVLLNEL